jgi:hypothetical protein
MHPTHRYGLRTNNRLSELTFNLVATNPAIVEVTKAELDAFIRKYLHGRDFRLVMPTEGRIKRNFYKVFPAVDTFATLAGPNTVTYTTHKTSGLTLHLSAYDLVPKITHAANEEPLIETIGDVPVLYATTEKQSRGLLHQHNFPTVDNQ